MNIIDEPESKLDRLLRLASTEPAHRPEFCQHLLDSLAYVIGSTGDDELGEKYLDKGSSISLQSWERPDGTSVIPFFTSLLHLQKSVETESNYLELPVRILFEMTLGSELMINPNSEYGKEFLPDEVASLLQNGIGQETQQRVIEHETEILIGEPDKYPSIMIDSLTTLFSKHDCVAAAYLALIQDEGEDEVPNLIIGLQGEGDLDRVIQEAAAVAWDTTDEDEIVDFITLGEDEDDGISEYFFNESKPFYDRSWGSRLKDNTLTGKA